MKYNLFISLVIFFTVFLSAEAKRQIPVNMDVTTHIVMPENIKMVDISTKNIVGNQCTDNIVRIKPYIEGDTVRAPYMEGQLLGTITLIGERYLTQYDIVYSHIPQKASSIYNISYMEMQPYNNPEVSMPESEMARYAWAVFGSNRKYNQIVANANGIKSVINNIYSIGDYFFIDYSLYNQTNISYDIAEMRVKLTDKKEVKATNSQTIELTPTYILNIAKKFKKSFRNVLVLPKLTFPEEKMLTIEISENQISGRVITMVVEYSDILNADCFDADILSNLPINFAPHLYK